MIFCLPCLIKGVQSGHDDCRNKLWDEIEKSLQPITLEFERYGERKVLCYSSDTLKKSEEYLWKFKALAKRKMGRDFCFDWNVSCFEDWSYWKLEEEVTDEEAGKWMDLHCKVIELVTKRMGLIPPEFDQLLSSLASTNLDAVVNYNTDT